MLAILLSLILDCPPQMIIFGVHREELKSGWMHSTGGKATATRVIEVDYYDNRLIDDLQFESYGMVSMTNESELRRRIKYRQKIPIQQGTYVIYQDTPEYEVCIQNGLLIFYTEHVTEPGITHTLEWSYAVEITPHGDLNGDSYINGTDLGLFMVEWSMSESEADFNEDGVVDADDFGILLTNWRDD